MYNGGGSKLVERKLVERVTFMSSQQNSWSEVSSQHVVGVASEAVNPNY